MKKFSISYMIGVVLYFSSLSVYAQSTDWQYWLSAQIQKHPDMIAAREQLLGNNAKADAIEQPLYNPELSSELERNGKQNNYQLGIRQTIDWWDRREVSRLKSGYIRNASEALYQQQVLQATAEAMATLVEWRAAKNVAAIAKKQYQQLQTQLELVQKRQRLGDLGSIDAELTFLSLSQQLAQVAEAKVVLKKSEAKARELIPSWTPKLGGVPQDFWPSSLSSNSNQDLLKHPRVASAYARWQSQKEEAELERRTAKADPTVGVKTGQDGGKNVIGLTLSIPLNVRNDFSAETRAAERAGLEEKARFQSIYRKQRFSWQAAYSVWKSFDQQYQRWKKLAQGRVEKSAELLERQWNSRDLSTTDYLLALNQRAESLIAGIELEKQTQLALLDALKQSGLLLQAKNAEHQITGIRK
ncbi:TolC family protein [Hydrogenovibrio crunogenus]|uniref:TolC family protein n=1 Tax=Hydrogenovibrio crunogenus TaxID=39765 RepID=A0A4P7P060_9GAMM|nr:TolC family protein [Hydrogenovibrio crunogenus]QBZ83453.1 TolC family protein [Hydrogenovibrio crunogenus]